MPSRPIPLALAAATLLFGAACAEKEQPLSVTGAWVRLSPVPANPSAGYFTVKGGPQDVQLISVSSKVAIRAEMHETMTGMQGMASMKPIQSVPIPAGGEVKFEPGGRHVMFWNVNPGIKPPRRMPLVFSFSDGTRLEVAAQTVAAGAAGPAAE